MNRSASNAPTRPPNPVREAPFFSRHSFWWLRDLFRSGLQRPIDTGDIFVCQPHHESANLTRTFAELWSEEKQLEKPSLLRVLRRVYAKQFLLVGVLVMMLDMMTKIIQPHCLGGLVTYFSPIAHDLTATDAYLYAGTLVGCAFLSVTTMQTFVFHVLQLGMCIRQTCCAMIYRKLLRLTKAVAVDGLNGQVINLMSNDVARFDQVLAFFHYMWRAPVELLLMGYFIYREIQWYGLIGVGLMLCFIPLQTYIGQLAAKFRLRTAQRTDRRVRLMNEIIQAIQVIKMYTWERPFAKLVDQIRRQELLGVRGALFIRGSVLSFNIISRVSIFVSLASFVYCGNVFTARKVYIVTSYFNFLYHSLLSYWPLGMSSFSETRISIQRIQQFLLQPESKAQALAARAKRDSKQGVHHVELQHLLLKSEQTWSSVNALGDHIQPSRKTGALQLFGSRTLSEPQPAGRTDKSSVRLAGATARWLSDSTGFSTGIENVTLDVEKGKLCAVIGTVGAGKSTLLQAILGELELDSGRLEICGTLSYASQEPWLFEGSIRQNILFCEQYDAERYQQVLRVCSLQRDIELFPHGDATIVGERGTSLSGGQRARVNLARAVYKQADVYLLDDPLSAVDAHVGKQIFERCVQRFLADKCCVLVTHQLQYLRDVGHVVLMAGGRVEQQGTFQELREAKVHSLLWSGVEEEEEPIGETDCEETAIEVGADPEETAKKITKISTPDELCASQEKQIQGGSSVKVLASYLAAVDNRCIVSAVLVMFVAAQTCVSAVDFLVSRWVHWEQHHIMRSTTHPTPNVTTHNGTATSDATFDEASAAAAVVAERFQYIYTYAGAIVVVLYLVFQRSFAFFQMCLRASRRMHDHLFRGITRAWMRFFNANPSGRILNRFSTDIGSIDTVLPMALMDVLLFLCELVAVFVLVSIANAWLLVPTLAMAAVTYALRHVYISTARSVKRIESMTRSPMFSHTNATLQGLSTIRTFRAEATLLREFEAHQDLNTSAWYTFLATSRAFSLWLELTCCAYMSLVLLSFLVFANDSIGTKLGLAMTQIFNLFDMCQWGMRQSAELENQLTSVERVREYTDEPAEPPLETAPDAQPPADWPTAGAIEFAGLTMRYQPDSVPVLRDLHFRIAAGEKIGIVGRTGAGKSSIIQALFRLAYSEGTIRIDGVDTGPLGLHDLRSKISIIPQDPILFSGTMRLNLDPFGEHADERIWSVLEQVQLRQVVASQTDGLECRMSDGGANMSMGQRQLVCLARAILRQNRVLILDEATANVDAQTDGLIQRTIREHFRECTVLTIAHRLHTVMDSDRVLVMDAGRMAEFGHPKELLENGDGLFRGLVEQTGGTTSRYLVQLAEESWQSRKEEVEEATTKKSDAE